MWGGIENWNKAPVKPTPTKSNRIWEGVYNWNKNITDKSAFTKAIAAPITGGLNLSNLVFGKAPGSTSKDKAYQAAMADYVQRTSLANEKAAINKATTGNILGNTINKGTVNKTPTKSTGGVSTNTPAVAPVAQDPWYYSGDQIAGKFGIDYNYDNILQELRDVTSKKFDIMNTQTRRAEDTGVRAARVGYDEYINKLNQTKNNAAQTGMRKGLGAAEAIAQMLSSSEALSGNLQATRDTMHDLGEAQGLAETEATTMARTQYNELGKYLAGIGAQYEGNAVNKLSAQLMAQAQTQAASIGANAQKSTANSANDYIYNIMLRMSGGDRNKADQLFYSNMRDAGGYDTNKNTADAVAKGNR